MANKPIDWENVRRVLVVRLRSIGDAVLSTPSLFALRRFLPEARIDVLLEDWVAPLFDGFDVVDNVLTTKRGDAKNRAKVMFQLANVGYDVAYNLHGGTTATFFTASTLAKHRVGFADYRYKFLYNFLAPPSSEFWNQAKTHSAEQQLALLGWSGVPVSDKPKTRLFVTDEARQSIKNKLDFQDFALIHPVAAFDTKQWATEKFARIIEFLSDKNLKTVAVATSKERETLSKLQEICRVPIQTFDDLTLPEITALANQAKIFIGNDSGIAHIASAVQTPSVVIFGSSNTAHWRPFTDAPNEIVTENFPCAPCAGYKCLQFETPHCIEQIEVKSVIDAIEKILRETEFYQMRSI